MTIACADCGCLVDRGIRVESCADFDCCCRHLPVATRTTRWRSAESERSCYPTRRWSSSRRWATAREALAVVFDRRHLVATTRTAAVVGTVLFAINQLDVVVTGGATPATWVKATVTYLVPFTVANLGILTATPPEGMSDPPATYNARALRDASMAT